MSFLFYKQNFFAILGSSILLVLSCFLKYLNRRSHLSSVVCKAMVVAIGQLNAAGVQLFLVAFIYGIDASLLGQTRAIINTNL